MDYSIKGYLNRLSVERLEEVLKFCKENNDQYKHIIKDVNQILKSKEKQNQ